ncbi:MAG: ABC transporter permease [Bacteroidota bacterium]|nr:ABC transporter permease [Bacteroidota bacterium]
MLKNYFKIAFRNLWKHRVFSLINVLGLAVGMTAGFLIFMFVRFELSYDGFHTKADRIYRVVADIKTPTEVINASGPAWAVPSHIKLDFPEVEDFVRVSQSSWLVRKGDVKFQEDHSLLADSSFFRVFDFPLLHGDPKTALTEPLSIVMSETAARKYFGDANPVGQTVLFSGDAFPAKVTGIMKDIPENSQIRADMLVSMSTLTKKLNPTLDDQWGNYGLTAYLLLKPGTNAAALQGKMPAFLERRNGKEMHAQQMTPTLFLEPMRDVYLHSTRDGSKTGNINNVYIFSIIAVFIMLIACINFINLTTARSVERAKEVGIRKVVGAARTQLAGQFVGESVLLCLIAFVITIGLSALLLPSFNVVAGKTISHGIFDNAWLILDLLLASIGIGLLAGVYPALVLSSFRPVMVLKCRFSTGTRGTLLRKGLVVLQFVISIGLIISTIVVSRQMNFMRSQDLGFNKDQMMVVDSNNDPGKDAFKQAITGMPGVLSTSTSSSVPGGGNMGAYSEIENVRGEMQIANLDLYFVDYDYIPQFQIKMAAGRPFSREFGSDTTQAMVINEAASKLFGYPSPAAAIGRRFKQWGREGTIVGVTKDFHFRSLQQKIAPLSMRIEPHGTQLVIAKVSPSNLPATISAIEGKWKTLIPNRPFSYTFLDESFDKQYKSEERFGKLFLQFAVLAIFISCLGLLGLASYSTLQRTKEIGIRKVMGASVGSIVNLLSKDFLQLVIISFFIAAPLAGWLMYKWLENFAYRTHLAWWVFLASCLLALVIALGTISVQAIRSAVANPVRSLRTE